MYTYIQSRFYRSPEVGSRLPAVGPALMPATLTSAALPVVLEPGSISAAEENRAAALPLE
jgi:hypothetical protein